MDYSSVCSSLSSLGQEDDVQDIDIEVVETDPTGRYVRYKEILGQGAWKTVYKAFDEVDGIEVAWSQVEMSPDILQCPKLLQSLCDEAKLLKSLKHENIMRCYHSWIDVENNTINMITELFKSGDLKHYCKKHNHLDRKPIKNWARQILKALNYLHSHNAPIIHRDLKCANIFVHGNSGKVKIGDLGFARVMERASARSVTGTPGFMAPELYDEEYNQLVDIYAFGMCMLQMVSHEEPYHECKNHGQIFKKVSNGIRPAALAKVSDPEVRQFIEKCLAPVAERPGAADLLEDPFLAAGDSGRLTCSPSLTEAVCCTQSLVQSNEPDLKTSEQPEITHQNSRFPESVEMERVIVCEDNTFRLHGKMEMNDAIAMTLNVSNLGGCKKKIEFLFFLQTDTTGSVMEEMVVELELSNNDAALIHVLMEELIAAVTRSEPDLAETKESMRCECDMADVKESMPQIVLIPEDCQNSQNVPAEEAPCSKGLDTESDQISDGNQNEDTESDQISDGNQNDQRQRRGKEENIDTSRRENRKLTSFEALLIPCCGKF